MCPKWRRVERRRAGGQANVFHLCPPFRASWHIDIRPIHHGSFSPSGIPYGGFSPVRLQTGFRWQSSPDDAGLYATSSPFSLAFRSPRGAIAALWRRPGFVRPDTPVQRPLAVAAGCVVPPRHRLLWPHPRLWGSPGVLCSSTPGLCLAAESQRFPNLSCVSVDPCRGLYPGGRAVFDCCRSARIGLRPLGRGSAPAKSRQEVGSRRGTFRGLRPFAYRYGPDRG